MTTNMTTNTATVESLHEGTAVWRKTHYPALPLLRKPDGFRATALLDAIRILVDHGILIDPQVGLRTRGYSFFAPLATEMDQCGWSERDKNLQARGCRLEIAHYSPDMGLVVIERSQERMGRWVDVGQFIQGHRDVSGILFPLIERSDLFMPLLARARHQAMKASMQGPAQEILLQVVNGGLEAVVQPLMVSMLNGQWYMGGYQNGRSMNAFWREDEDEDMDCRSRPAPSC